jgi:hypothetical protein
MLDLWYRALQSERGIEVICTSTEEVRARLYKLRREVQDADLASISICQSPFDSDKLWLIKRTARDAPPRG